MKIITEINIRSTQLKKKNLETSRYPQNQALQLTNKLLKKNNELVLDIE